MKFSTALLMLLLLLLSQQSVAETYSYDTLKGTDRYSYHKIDDSCGCFIYQKYVVIVKDADGQVGQNIFIYQRDPADTNPCDKKNKVEYYKIDNEEFGLWYWGVMDRFLFVDLGCCPEPRGVAIYDLESKKPIYSDSYFSPISIINSRYLQYDKSIDVPVNSEKAHIKNCPQARIWRKQGLSIGFSQRVKFDIYNQKAIIIGKKRCCPTQ